ncbi:hypothetical protein OB920_08225 [Halobacteria archaeon HArc-gm2]|nr:hypothetical protein [Halobacteria archaeon HArc-gm2]
MSSALDRPLSEDPPVRPERVMPLVAAVVTGLAGLLVAVGLLSLWPTLARTVAGSVSPLALAIPLFGALLVLVVVASARTRPRRTR